jgi:hypothetical protein
MAIMPSLPCDGNDTIHGNKGADTNEADLITDFTSDDKGVVYNVNQSALNSGYFL